MAAIEEMKIWIITQDQEGERFQALKAKLEALGYAFEVWPGVDVSPAVSELGEIDEMHEYALRYAGRGPGIAQGQVGATLAHVDLWREVARSEEAAIILEDDAIPGPGFDPGEIEAAGFAVSFLWSYKMKAEGYDPEESDPGFYPLESAPRAAGSVAYAITPEGARSLLNPLLVRVERSSRLQAALEDPDHPVRKYIEQVEGIGEVMAVAHQPVDFYLGYLMSRRALDAGVSCPPCIDHGGLRSTIAGSAWWTAPRERKALSLSQKKQRAARSSVVAYEREQAAGVEIEGILPEPVLLDGTVSARDAFVAKMLMLREAQEVAKAAGPEHEAAFLASPQKVTDRDGEPVELANVQAVRQLLLAYGAQWEERWRAHTEKLSRIRAAETEEELDAALASV